MRANLLIVTQADVQFIVIESGQQSFFDRSTHTHTHSHTLGENAGKWVGGKSWVMSRKPR